MDGAIEASYKTNNRHERNSQALTTPNMSAISNHALV